MGQLVSSITSVEGALPLEELDVLVLVVVLLVLLAVLLVLLDVLVLVELVDEEVVDEDVVEGVEPLELVEDWVVEDCVT